MAKRKFGEKSQVLYRTEKFEVFPSQEELAILLTISESLRLLFNSALAERFEMFATFIAPLYAKLKSATSEETLEIRKEIREANKEHSITLFGQINALTAKRALDEAFASIPRNWQEETLDAVDGAFKSFIALRKNGDFDALPPRPKQEGFFQKIPGRFGFKVGGDQGTLSCGAGRKFSFQIPRYQQERFIKAIEFKKFELYRDESRIDKPGRFWISIACELSKPEATFFGPEKAVYLALGASSLGIISSLGEEVLPLWRSDKHWIPKIEAVEKRMKGCQKGSNLWKRLDDSRRRMHSISSRQRLQDEREVVQYLFHKYGHHFVVTDYIVRSKEGKLADREKTERAGSLGLNWSAQNTGSFGRLVLQLEEKVKEYKGSVRKHKLILDSGPPSVGHENKLWMARRLRESFLASLENSVL